MKIHCNFKDKLLIRFVLIGFLGIGCSNILSAQIIYEQDFEKGGKFERISGRGGFYYDEGNIKMSAPNSNAVSISSKQKKTGNFAIRYELNRPKGYYKRSETVFGGNGVMHFNKDYWISFDYYRADWKYDSTEDLAPIQIHDVAPAYPDVKTLKECRDGGYKKNSPFFMKTIKDKFQVWAFGGKKLWEGPILHKQWVNILVHFRASKEGDGIVEVWRNGKKLGATAKGANIVKTDLCNNIYGEHGAPFLKLGVYHSEWWTKEITSANPATESDSRMLYVDNVKIGKGSANPFGGTLAVEDENLETTGIQIYPNPTANKINIQFSENQNVESISIYDVLGKEVFARKIDASESKVTLHPNLSKGVYFLKIESDKGEFNKKIIIK